MRTGAHILGCLAIGLTLSAPILAYSGGSGTEADPYKISTVADWQELMNTTVDWDKCFILLNDIDLAGVSLTPIGNGTPSFTGVFDGNGQVIRNAAINLPDQFNVGLFGSVGSGGQVKNLGAVDVNITGASDVGGLCGENMGDDMLGNGPGTISMSYATGSVTSSYMNVGGLVGSNSGVINSCYSMGLVKGTGSVGGLVGFMGNPMGGSMKIDESTIMDCCTTSSISFSTNSNSMFPYIGGLVGYVYAGTIMNCYTMDSIINISADFMINSFAGGFVGAAGTSMGSKNLIIRNCYAVGPVSKDDYIGGLVGSVLGDNVTISSCFWDIQTSGQTSSQGGMGLTTPAMHNPETYLRAFWDFVGEFRNGTEDLWTMPVGGGYPILAWQVQRTLPNDEMAGAISIGSNASMAGTNVGATGLDLTVNGYNDCLDVWYLFEPSQADKFTIQVQSPDLNATVAVFDPIGREIIFNDDFFGEKSLVILKARAGGRYYIRIAGVDAQTGDFTLSVAQGAIQAIQGDLNYDGVVDLSDFTLFAEHWLDTMI
jgi:hypothetical protein